MSAQNRKTTMFRNFLKNQQPKCKKFIPEFRS